MRYLKSSKSFPHLAGLMILFLFAVMAQAQPPAQQDEPEKGQVIVQRIKHGFVVAPDYRFTEVDGDFAHLAGAYGGWLLDEQLFIGAGAYWLTGTSADNEMTYGGVVLEWVANPMRRVGFSVRGLVGGGTSRLSVDLEGFPRDPRFRGFAPRGHLPGFPGPSEDVRRPSAAVATIHEGFLVAEPQANVLVRMTGWLRVGFGAGYRLIGGASGLEERLRGASASLSLQMGSF